MKSNGMTSFAACIACGMVIGSAVGTCAAVMMSTKKKKPEGIREKAVNAVDTVGTIMHNIANMAK